DGCTGTDSVAVTVLPRGHIAARIDRDLTVFPGSGIRVPILLEQAIDLPSLDSFDLVVRYDPRVLLLDSITTTGTVTQGWRRSGGVINRFAGSLTDRFIAPPGSRPGDGRLLLLLNFRGFVGDADSSDIPFSITPYTYRCADPSGGNGLVRLDSICGLNHRLIELVAPFRYALDGNQPNPFYPDTKIHFSLGLDGMTSLTIYDAAGKEVARPVASYMGPGNYAVSWDAAGLPAGVYYYRLVSGDWARSGTMILAR
ncbi:MAG: T9SS type A sorting domain-containing protein, partial [Bacteroidota bacterium]